MARRRKKNLRYAVLAIVISLILWSIAHGSSSVERGYDIPLLFHDLPDTLVITDQSDEEINIRVLGSRVALRNLRSTRASRRAVTRPCGSGRIWRASPPRASC